MTLLQIVVLAIVQGFTEFLPISSSGHLVLTPVVFGWPDQGLAFDVAVHLGTLAGVVTYFYRDLVGIAGGVLAMRPGKPVSANGKLGLLLVAATIPAGLVALAAGDLIASVARDPLVIATTTLVFGIALWAADALGRKVKTEQHYGLQTAITLGIAQALALIPGTSRSGITMTAALALGFTRTAAARFSFLMSVPVIVLASLKVIKDLVDSGEAVRWGELALGAALSGLVAYLTIRFFLKFVEGMGMAPFALYRIALAAVIVGVFA
ncbi:MAG: undecaprenyl-diphosphate phosphatase [Pseudomonadota bacterium]